VQWGTWTACGLASVAAVISLVVTAAGSNREGRVALPLAIAAAVLATSAVTSGRSGWFGALLYVVATLALLYEMILAASLPVRLTIEGTCPAALESCPLGFERPETQGEMFVMYSAVIAGAVSLLLTFAVVEARYLRAPRPTA
jgi:hypothetical protein